MQTVIDGLRSFFASGKTKSYDFRLEQLTRLEETILSESSTIAKALHADLGKSESEAYFTEIGPVIAAIRFARGNLARWMRPQKVGSAYYFLPAKSRIYCEPLGVSLIISPWNYPFYLTLSPVIGAIAAGNCALIKPSELSTNTTRVIKKVLNLTFPTQYMVAVEGGVPETTEILTHQFDHIFFTGSTAVGRIVMQAAARHLTPVTLELGGKSPALVGATANIDIAARRIAWGKFTNSGQICVAPDYVYVHQAVAEDFEKKLRHQLREFYGENPRESADYGRIINDRHYVRLEKLVAAKDPGLLTTNDRTIRYFAPTIVKNASWQDALMQEEIFGPVLPFFSFSQLDDAFTEIRKRDKPLSAYLFSEDREEQNRFINELTFGGGCINDTVFHLGNENLPFGGVGASGIGSYHGKFSFLAFSHQKSIMHRTRFLDLDFRYPPYTEKSLATARRLFRF